MNHVRLMRGILLLIFLALPAIVAEGQTRFNFRAVHLIDGAGEIDLHFQDRETASVTGVPYETVSELLQNLSAENDQFNVKYAQSGSGLAGVLVDADISVESNREYIGVGYGSKESPNMAVLSRDRAQFPQPGKVLFRVLHASSIPLAVDVYVNEVGTTPTVGNVTQGMVSSFAPVEATSTSLTITAAGTKQPIVTVTAPFSPANPFVTLIITGDSPQNIKLYVLSISSPPNSTGSLVSLEEASYTDVRIVNLRPGSGDNPDSKLDIYLNKPTLTDLKVSDSLRYRYMTQNFGPLIADSLRIKFVPFGESPNQPVHQIARAFRNDTAYIVALSQFKDRRPTTLVLGRSPVEPLPPGPGTSLVRFANATDYYGPIRAEIVSGFDTIKVGPLEFKEQTAFENIVPGQPFSVRLFAGVSTTPIYSRPSEIGVVPGGAFMTIFAIGDDEKLSVEMLNESLPGRRPLVSFDGVGAVTVERAGNLDLSVAPNPILSSGRALIDLESAGRVELLMVDMTGRLVATTDEVDLEAGRHTLTIETDAVGAGSYTLLLRVDGAVRGSRGVVVVR